MRVDSVCPSIVTVDHLPAREGQFLIPPKPQLAGRPSCRVRLALALACLTGRRRLGRALMLFHVGLYAPLPALHPPGGPAAKSDDGVIDFAG